MFCLLKRKDMKLFISKTHINSHVTHQTSVVICCIEREMFGSKWQKRHFGLCKFASKISWTLFSKKNSLSNILKDSKNLRRDYEFFKRSYKKRRYGKYHVINEILYKWYGKCSSANVCPEGLLFQEEAMKIAKRLEKEE